MKQRIKILKHIEDEKNTIKLIDSIRSNIVDGKVNVEKYDYIIKNVVVKKKERN